jgi:pimeloyl-ACP methyl ester carboxylesterase
MPGSRRDLDTIFRDEVLEQFQIRTFSIDRAGYGESDAVGMDRRDVARDLLTVADHLGVDTFPVLAVSMGGTYALTVAALAPGRVERLVLAVPQALPYDDPEVIAALDQDGQEDVEAALRGPRPEFEESYRRAAAEMAEDSTGLLREAPAAWSALERRLVETEWTDGIAASLSFGLSRNHRGYYEDGLRIVRPLEIELSDIRCPVRIITASLDDWEPAVNAHRLARQLTDVALIELHDMGHFGPWVWPEMVLSLVVGG